MTISGKPAGEPGLPAAPAAPTSVRVAGVVAAAEGAAGLVMAAALVWRGLGGADQRVVGGFSLAGLFAVVGAGVLAAGWALARGKRWGRGVAVVANLMLLPVAWYAIVGSRQWGYGVPVAVVALVTLGLLFSPAAVRWTAGGRVGQSVTGATGEAANSERAGPDSR